MQLVARFNSTIRGGGKWLYVTHSDGTARVRIYYSFNHQISHVHRGSLLFKKP